METLTARKSVSVMKSIDDIALDITWSKIAERYFPHKSISWFYNKLRGVDGNGGEGEFNYAEKLQLQNALLDFSERVRSAARSIDV